MTEPLTARALLSRTNARITTLRRILTRDHRTIPDAGMLQRERAYLRILADLLHVERATARGRIHGTRFATLEDQRAWLASMEHRTCSNVTLHARLPLGATLVELRAGALAGDA